MIRKMEGWLGIDYGRRRVGVASWAEGGLAVPERVIKVKSEEEAVERVAALVKQGEVGGVVVGEPGGRMGEEVAEFVRKLRKRVKVGVQLWDETLSSREAVEKSVEARMGPKKRREWKDAMAAAIMLQSYVDYRERMRKDGKSV